jgi:hypothetical protein
VSAKVAALRMTGRSCAATKHSSQNIISDARLAVSGRHLHQDRFDLRARRDSISAPRPGTRPVRIGSTRSLSYWFSAAVCANAGRASTILQDSMCENATRWHYGVQPQATSNDRMTMRILWSNIPAESEQHRTRPQRRARGTGKLLHAGPRTPCRTGCRTPQRGGGNAARRGPGRRTHTGRAVLLSPRRPGLLGLKTRAALPDGARARARRPFVAQPRPGQQAF